MTNNNGKDRKLRFYIIAFLSCLRKLNKEFKKFGEYCYPVIENGFLGLYKCEVDNEEKLDELDIFLNVDEKAVEKYFPAMKKVIPLYITLYTWIIIDEELSKEDVLKLYEKILTTLMGARILG